MSAVLEQHGDSLLTSDVLTHLDIQLDSARRLLAIVLEQSAAIRQRQIPQVVRLAGALQAEIHRREVIELERLRLLERACVQLHLPPADITLTMLEQLMDEQSAQVARERTAELRGLLSEIQHEHHTNRALMQQELSFLDHLLRLAGGIGGYDAGDPASARRTRALSRRPVFDLEA